MPGSPAPTGSKMFDLLMLAIGLGAFALMAAYVAFCGRV
jgi:hypothetical protein